MAKEKQLLQSELTPETKKDIATLMYNLFYNLRWEKDVILRLAEGMKDNPAAIHHILTGRNGDKVQEALFDITENPHIHQDWAIIILNAARSQTYAEMSLYTKYHVLRWACKSNHPKVAKQLLSALSQEAIIELLNKDRELFRELFKSLPQQGELIEVLLEHFPIKRVAKVRNSSLVFFVYAALVKEDATQANELIPLLPLQSRGIILGEVANEISKHLEEGTNIRNNANSNIIKFMTADDVSAAEKGSNVFSAYGVTQLIEEFIKHGRDDLAYVIMYQNILGDKPRFNLLGDYFRDTVRHAARYGQINILATALACYACYGQKKVDVCVNELAAQQELPKEIQALLTDYSKPDSPFRRTIEQIKVLMRSGMSTSETFARVKETPTITVKLPSSSLNSSNGITTQPRQIVDNEPTTPDIGDEGIPIDKPYVTEGIDILLPDVIPDSGYSSTTSSSTTTASQSTAGGAIRWADDEDIAAISHVKDDHKARKASPKTSWQQRYEDSRSVTHSASSLPVSSSHTRSQRLAASSEQNVVTESANSTGVASEAGWLAKVNKGPTSFLKG